jgi:predicted XRE-type DNA-binding protein
MNDSDITFDGPYESAFDALDDPDRAANLKVRAKLMNRLQKHIDRQELTQIQAAQQMDVPQSRISLLVNGRISQFTIDYLLNMCTRAGIEVDIAFREPRLEEDE